MDKDFEHLIKDKSAPHLARYGLTREPFMGVDDNQSFYADANREQRLGLMHHLAPYSHLLVVIGEPGMGKTALLQQFVARANETWRLCVVNAEVGMGQEEFMEQVLAGYALSAEVGRDVDEQFQQLVAHLRALRQSAQTPILLVDDAQHLSAAAFELVLRLIEENDSTHMISVMLFGNPELNDALALPQLVSLQSRVAHAFDVPALTEQDAARYLRHRMRSAGAQDEGPFNAALVVKLYAASDGNPSRLNELAHNALLNKLNLGAESRPARSARGAAQDAGGGASASWKRPVILIGAVVAVVLLYRGLFSSAPPEEVVPPPPVAERAESLSLPPLPESAPVVREAPPVAESSAPLVEAPVVAERAAEATLQVAPVPPAPPEAAAAPAATSAPPAPVASPPPPPPVIAAAPPPAPTPAPRRDALRGADWLADQPASHYTLQLMALREEHKVRAFIEQHKLQEQAAYFPVQRNKQVLYALVYGQYPNRVTALAAAKKLPASFGKMQPWARSFKSVHDDLGSR